MAVRREKVILELEDKFSNPTLRAAAAAKTLDKSLNDIDASGTGANRSLSRTAVESRNLNREIDRTSGRLRLLVDAAVLLGPALVPIAAVGVPAMTGLANLAGAAALGVGTMVAAFQGVGTTLEAVNKAALEPTSENLEAARVAMQALSPQARELVRQVQDMRPAFTALRDAAAAGLFPGLTAALDDLDTALPNVENILFRVGEAAGELGEDLGSALSSERGRGFLDFLAAEMPQALTDLGHAAGNVAAGMGELWQAMTPVNRDVTGWLLDASRSFDDWASSLSRTQGFQDFIAYLRTSGPQVADAMAAIGNAVLQVVQAAAPLGGPTLAALEAFANVVGAIAGSSYGTALVGLAAGLIAVNRAMKAMDAIKGSTLFSNLAGDAAGASRSLSRLQGAGIAAGVGLSTALTAGTQLVEMFREDLPGVEQLTGMLMDLSAGVDGALPSEFNSLADSIERINNPSFWKGQMTSDTVLGFFGAEGRTLTNATDEVEALEAALTNMVGLQGPEAAEKAFAAIAENANLSAEQVAQLRDLMPGYVDALAGAENQARATGEAAATGFRRATSAAQQFRNAVAAANRALEGRASTRDYEQAIDDLTKAVRSNGRTLDINTQKGRDNAAALDAIASSALSVAENMRGTNRTAFLQAARRDMVDAAQKLGKTRSEAADLADRLLGLNQMDVRPRIEADSSAALNSIGSVAAKLAALDGQSATVTTHYQTTGSPPGSATFRPGLAAGGTVAGSRYPYRDKVLAMLAPGEEVISNSHGQADRHRELLKAINANRYASGGTVGGGSASHQRVSFDTATVDLRTPWGTQTVELIARSAARAEINSAARHDRMLRGE